MPKNDKIICQVCGNTKFRELYHTPQHPFFEGVMPRPYKKVLFFDLSIKECANCGFVFKKSSARADRKLDKFYKSHIGMSSAAADESEFSFGIAQRFIDTIVQNMGSKKIKTVLEIGCRDGFVLGQIRRRIGAKVVGVDVSTAKPYEDELGPLNIVHAYFPTPKIREKFDLIYAKAVLEHVSKIQPIVSNVQKQLNPGGMFVAQVPKVEQSLRDGNIGIFIHEHVNFFTKATLSLLCGRNGLRVKKVIEDIGSIIIICENINPGRIKTRLPKITYPQKYSQRMEKFKGLLLQGDSGFFGASQELFSYLYTALGNIPTRFNIYDNDKFKQGQYLGRNLIPIRSADEIKDKKIAIMPRTYAQEITQGLKKKELKSKIINIWKKY